MDADARRHFLFWLRKLGVDRLDDLLSELEAPKETRTENLAEKAEYVLDALSGDLPKVWALVRDGFRGKFHQSIDLFLLADAKVAKKKLASATSSSTLNR